MCVRVCVCACVRVCVCACVRVFFKEICKYWLYRNRSTVLHLVISVASLFFEETKTALHYLFLIIQLSNKVWKSRRNDEQLNISQPLS